MDLMEILLLICNAQITIFAANKSKEWNQWRILYIFAMSKS